MKQGCVPGTVYQKDMFILAIVNLTFRKANVAMS
jgi:hypothetical protein